MSDPTSSKTPITTTIIPTPTISNQKHFHHHHEKRSLSYFVVNFVKDLGLCFTSSFIVGAGSLLYSSIRMPATRAISMRSIVLRSALFSFSTFPGTLLLTYFDSVQRATFVWRESKEHEKMALEHERMNGGGVVVTHHEKEIVKNDNRNNKIDIFPKKFDEFGFGFAAGILGSVTWLSIVRFLPERLAPYQPLKPFPTTMISAITGATYLGTYHYLKDIYADHFLGVANGKISSDSLRTRQPNVLACFGMASVSLFIGTCALLPYSIYNHARKWRLIHGNLNNFPFMKLSALTDASSWRFIITSAAILSIYDTMRTEFEHNYNWNYRN